MVYVEIIKPVAYLPLEKYRQWVTISQDGKKVYIDRGPRGRMTIGIKSVKIIKDEKDCGA